MKLTGRGACWLFISGTIATTLIAGIATAPFAAFHFHTSQQYAVLTNMLAIPVSNLLVMPAALAAFVAMPMGLEAWPLAAMGFGIELMSRSARLVTSLPGAVTAVPAFPILALQLMIAGGLWLCIWRQHWRWLGVPVVIIGIYTATGADYPAALIGKNGELVALRDTKGKLAAAKARYGTYEYSRWLEADGDPRKPEQAWGRKPFRCDLEGCTGHIGKHLAAMPRSSAALIDDCRRAAVLILTFPKPPGCKTTATVLDYPVLRRLGTHALHIRPDGTLRIETVEQFRGSRPWTLTARTAKRKRPNHRAKRTIKSRPNRVRPEIEDDGHPLYWFR
jgi:competence protein ComEC